MLQTKFKYENKQRAITQKLCKQEIWFLCTALPLIRSIHPQNFITIACLVLEICTRKNLSIKKKRRARTPKLRKQELRFICIVLPLDKIYQPTKFHNHSKYSFQDMHQTKLKYETKQRAITQKISKQKLRFM